MTMQPYIRSRPVFPTALVDLEPDEYEEMLREARYSEKLIQQELLRLATFKQRYVARTVPATAGDDEDDEDPIARAGRRRRGRASTREVEDGEEV